MENKKIFWEGVEKDYTFEKPVGVILDPSNIFQAVSTFEFRFVMWPEIPGTKENDYQLPSKHIDEDGDECDVSDMDETELAQFVDEIVGSESKWATDDYVSLENILCFDLNEKTFFNLDDCEAETCYSYVCNSNWKTITYDDAYDTSYELEILNSFNLDIWDGSNHYFPKGSTGNHALLEKVIIDGEEKGLFWHEWSQWQGSELDTGYFVTAEEVLERLAGLYNTNGEYWEEKPHPELDEIREWLTD